MKMHLLSTLNFKLSTSRRSRGMYLPVILMAAVIFISFGTALASMALSNIKMANLHSKKLTAVSVAEAGINYYLWHLSHNNTDYCDGTNCIGAPNFGPYIHNYTNQNGDIIGSYDLFITPPSTGQSFVTVKSVGHINNSNLSKSIITTIGIPSFTKYTLMTVGGEQLWVGPGEKITGTVHVNGSGLYNEGEITGDASSTESSYQSWNWGTQPGVAGPGIFGGEKLYPVPQADLNQISVDIRNLRDDAQIGMGDYYDASNKYGYHIVLKNNSYDLYKVDKYSANDLNIQNETLISNKTYPAAGVIFAEDNLWVEGTLNNHQVTIIAADPELNGNQSKRIIIPNIIKYTNYDGSDKLGLISQSDILLTRNAPTDMEIDAAMLAKDGQIRINPYHFEHKNKIKVYGSLAHMGGLLWTYDYGNGQWSGYENTETVVDQNNVLNPPPKFPTTGSYSILSWREEN